MGFAGALRIMAERTGLELVIDVPYCSELPIF